MLKRSSLHEELTLSSITADDLRRAILSHELGGLLDDPQTSKQCRELLQNLYRIGSENLSLARLAEGHVDAVQIVTRHGTDTQCQGLAELLAQGALLGVWNAPHPDQILRLENDKLTGAKSYASGAGILTHALVNADAEAPGKQLVLLDLHQQKPEINTNFWRPIGMKPTATHQVFWNAATVEPAQRIGTPSDYELEPWFSGGALRFVAAQAGAISAIVREVVEDLRNRERTQHPMQQARLAQMLFLQRSIDASIERAASQFGDDERFLAEVALARTTTYAFGDEVLKLAQQSVGLQGLMEDHPLARKLTDLMVYLRQPGPDAQTAKVASALSRGILEPKWVQC